MSYLVLARKYRPQNFADLVGQEHVAQTLTNAIALGRVHHAFLFTGARGVGKTSAARILAKALCCAQGPTATPCGTCAFCTEIATGQSVDVVEIDGASNRGVDDARNLREAVRYAPSRGRKKVYIIDEVHMFTTEAFNALLKTLEEPPPHVVFILATTEVHRVPITILSRCQRFDFKLIPTERLTGHLAAILGTEGISAEEPGLRLLARQAAGSVRDALSLLDQVIAFVGDAPITHERVVEVLGVADRRLLAEIGDAVLARDPAGALRTLASAIDRGIDLISLSRAFLGFLHDVEIAGLVKDADPLIDATAEEVAAYRGLYQRAPRGLLGSLFDRWARAVDEASRAQTPRLLLEMALVDLCFTEPLLPLGDLLERLTALEGRLEGSVPSDSGPRGGGGPRRTSEPPPAVPRPSRASAAPAMAAPQSNGVASPAAAAPPPVASGTASGIVRIEDAWDRLRVRLQDRPALAAALDHASIESWKEGRLVLLFGEKLLVDQVEKSRPFLEEVLLEITALRTTIELKVGGGVRVAVVPSQAWREAESAASERKRREEEARSHPIIRKAEALFGVAPREIKVP